MYNKAQLIGRLGAAPNIRYTPDGKAVANFYVATTETWKDKSSGERKERTEWHRVVMFGKLAEIAHDYLEKGCLTLFEGPIRTRKWQRDGIDRYTTEIHADKIKMLGGKSDNSSKLSSSSSASSSPSIEEPPAYDGSSNDDFDDDIPF